MGGKKSLLYLDLSKRGEEEILAVGKGLLGGENMFYISFRTSVCVL